jgi:hypothetical protein
LFKKRDDRHLRLEVSSKKVFQPFDNKKKRMENYEGGFIMEITSEDSCRRFWVRQVGGFAF